MWGRGGVGMIFGAEGVGGSFLAVSGLELRVRPRRIWAFGKVIRQGDDLCTRIGIEGMGYACCHGYV